MGAQDVPTVFIVDDDADVSLFKTCWSQSAFTLSLLEQRKSFLRLNKVTAPVA